MNKIIKFGEDVAGYNIPVLNEREIRAAAGMLFLATYTSLLLILFKNNFIMIKYVITIFLADFIIRVLVSPKYSPTLIAGRLIVSRQNPEYVGAAQKKVAWILGVVLAAIMFLLMVVVNSYSAISGIICLICLIFLFFESVFGICLGCLLYGWIYREKAQYCPGEICDRKTTQEIQKTSLLQIGVVIAFTALIITAGYVFNDYFSIKPMELFAMLKAK